MIESQERVVFLLGVCCFLGNPSSHTKMPCDITTTPIQLVQDSQERLIYMATKVIQVRDAFTMLDV